MALKTYGPMAVDWENRIDFDRLRRERLARAKALLAKSEMGALLCFDMNNVRYLTATHIGTWAQDKISRFSLLPQNDEPILWDFGSAARHHQQNCPWLGERSRAGIPLLRGAMSPEMGRAENVARKIKVELEKRGLHKEPLGIDVVEPPILFALQKEGIKIVDGQQLMSDARVIKTKDEISLLNHSAMMVDAAYDELYRAMKPGMSENQAVGLASKVLYDLGSEYVEHGLPHLLLPVLHDRVCVARDDRRVQAMPRIFGRGDCAGAAGEDDGGNCFGVAEGGGIWISGRRGGICAAVWARNRTGDLGKAGDQPDGFARTLARDQAGDGVRAGNVLAFDGWMERRAD